MQEKLGGTEQGMGCGGTGEQTDSAGIKEVKFSKCPQNCGSSEIVASFPPKRSRFLSLWCH